jgi:hypothetical protein
LTLDARMALVWPLAVVMFSSVGVFSLNATHRMLLPEPDIFFRAHSCSFRSVPAAAKSAEAGVPLRKKFSEESVPMPQDGHRTGPHGLR